jgi:hypothetical protein
VVALLIVKFNVAIESHPAAFVNVAVYEPLVVYRVELADHVYDPHAVTFSEPAEIPFIVTDTLLEFEHAPLVVYVTVYVPGVDALTSIAPEPAFNDNPAVLENVPPLTPVIVGIGSAPLAQYDAAP